MAMTDHNLTEELEADIPTDLIRITIRWYLPWGEIAAIKNLNPEYDHSAVIQVPFTPIGLQEFWRWRYYLNPEGRALVTDEQSPQLNYLDSCADLLQSVKFNVVMDTDPAASTWVVTASASGDFDAAQKEGRERLRDLRWAMQEQGMDLENASLYMTCGVPGYTDSSTELQVVNYPEVSEKTVKRDK